MPSLKQLSHKKEILSRGHRLCPGCGASIIVRQVLLVADKPVVVACPTGCLEVATTIYPFTAWKCPFIHCAFENVAATLSGVETAYRFFKKQGKIKEDVRFVIFAGDGGTYDIGLQSLSGMLERGHKILYVCYDNEAYMNTGIQRSSASPKGAYTTTTPSGKAIPEGKTEFRKDLTQIVAAHHIPYAAQASPAYHMDLMRKVQKALAADGPSFINVFSFCPRGWRYPADKGIEVAKLAVLTGFWPLYEIENGQYKITYQPKKKRPLKDFLQVQGRFKHLFKEENQHLIEELEKEVEMREKELAIRAKESVNKEQRAEDKK